MVYVLDASRSHAVPEGHYRAESRGVLVVDRYSAYKAMTWVKDGVIVLAFCWSHVRRDFVRVGKGWPELKTWALDWLRRIRVLYQLNHRRLAAESGSVAFGETDGCLRHQRRQHDGDARAIDPIKAIADTSPDPSMKERAGEWLKKLTEKSGGAATQPEDSGRRRRR